MKKISILLAVFLFVQADMFGQKRMYVEGESLFESGRYQEAIQAFNADKYILNNKKGLYLRAASHFQVGDLAAAKQDVKRCVNMNNYPDELHKLIAEIYQEEHQFRKAAMHYKRYLRGLDDKSELKKEIIHRIKQCGHSLQLRHIPAKAFVDNLGDSINTRYDEFGMVQSPNFNKKYYFSSNRPESTGGRRDKDGRKNNVYGHYRSDMYAANMVNNNWSNVKKLNPFINTSLHEKVLDFSTDGSVLFYLRGSEKDRGKILTDTFKIDKEQILEPTIFQAPIDGGQGDVYLNIFNNNTIVFASARAGGFGGYDLYLTYRIKNQWSKPINLGSNVNTAYDEISPFITNDGKQLYFSSNRPQSLGGFDVFQCSFNTEDNAWGNVQNMGIPINSAANDSYYYINNDGYSAYFTSDRKSGMGGTDLYIAYLQEQEIAQLVTNADIAGINVQDFEPATSAKQSDAPASQPVVKDDKELKKQARALKRKEAREAKRKRRAEKKRLKELRQEAKRKARKQQKEQDAPMTKSENVNKQKTNEIKQQIVETAEEPDLSSDEAIKNFIINPIYFDEQNPKLLTDKNKAELASLITLFEYNPSLLLTIEIFQNKKSSVAKDLYFSAKLAETISNYMVNSGVAAERITIKSYGSQFPLAKPMYNGRNSKIAERLNSRIQFKIRGQQMDRVQYQLVKPFVMEELRSFKGEELEAHQKGLSYRVQVMASKKMFLNQVLIIYNHPMIEKNVINDYYKYTIGLYRNFKQSLDIATELKDMDINDAFVVPYIDGVRLLDQDINSLINKYPDLVHYKTFYGK